MPFYIFPDAPELGVCKIGSADEFVVIMFTGETNTNFSAFLNPLPVEFRMVEPGYRSPSFCIPEVRLFLLLNLSGSEAHLSVGGIGCARHLRSGQLAFDDHFISFNINRHAYIITALLNIV